MTIPLTFDAEILKISDRQPGEQPKLKMLLLPQSCPMETTVEKSEIFHVEQVHQLGSLNDDLTNTVDIDDTVSQHFPLTLQYVILILAVSRFLQIVWLVSTSTNQNWIIQS